MRLQSVAALAAVAVTAVLTWFGNDLRPWWPLMWFAPLPVLLYAARSDSSWWRTAFVAFVAWLIGNFCMWRYFQALHRPFADWALTYSAISLVFAGAVLLFRALLSRGFAWRALLAFPAA